MYEVKSVGIEVHARDALSSLALFVGTGACNARCSHCAGLIHRRYAPRRDGEVEEDIVRETLASCYARGARSLSLSSSGEPTLSPISVTKVLGIAHNLAGMAYSPINLYSNGIRIGEDKVFCEQYLPRWRGLGLSTIYVTVHDTDERRNAEVYGVRSYPPFADVIGRIHDAGLTMRANLLLGKTTICTLDSFVASVTRLREIGADSISAWPLRDINDRLDYDSLPEELPQMWMWAAENGVRLLAEESHDMYASGKKLTLFPDGTLSGNWCSR
jgi:molybdenum cofactor biosynthesis enzyme MoaA